MHNQEYHPDQPYNQLSDVDKHLARLIAINEHPQDWTEADWDAWRRRDESERYRNFPYTSYEDPAAQPVAEPAPSTYTPEEVTSWLGPEPRGLKLGIEIARMVVSDAVDTVAYLIRGDYPWQLSDKRRFTSSSLAEIGRAYARIANCF